MPVGQLLSIEISAKECDKIYIGTSWQNFLFREKFLGGSSGKFLKFVSLKWHFQFYENTFWKIFRFSKQDFSGAFQDKAQNIHSFYSQLLLISLYTLIYDLISREGGGGL